MVKFHAHKLKRATYITIDLDSPNNVTPIFSLDDLNKLKWFLKQSTNDPQLFKVEEPIHMWIRLPK